MRRAGALFVASLLVAGGLFVLTAAPASAASASTSVTVTFSDPAWQRPNEGSPPGSTASGDYAWDAAAFKVTTSGPTTVSSVVTSGFGNFLCVYATAFNPAAPLSNVVACDNDDVGSFWDRVFVNLTAGTQ